MKQLLISLLILLGLTACGPDPMSRASNEPWSTKQRSVTTMEETARPQVPMVVNGDTVRQRALSVLHQAIRSPNARYRANAIESLRFAPIDVLQSAIQRGLADDNRGVRFVAAMMIGEVKLCELSLLLEPLLLDESQSVQAAAMCSMYQCGSAIDVTPLARMLQSENPEHRGNAALVLGRMGNLSAIQMIRDAARQSPSSITPIRRRLINLQMAEALVLLGERNELEVIRAALFSSAKESEVTALACVMAGRLQDIEITSTLEGIVYTPERYADEIRLIAATALAEIDPRKMPLNAVLVFTANDSDHLRSQCATALGMQGNQLSLCPLAILLKDSAPMVQIAAAGAVLRIDKSGSMAIVD